MSLVHKKTKTNTKHLVILTNEKPIAQKNNIDDAWWWNSILLQNPDEREKNKKEQI